MRSVRFFFSQISQIFTNFFKERTSPYILNSKFRVSNSEFQVSSFGVDKFANLKSQKPKYSITKPLKKNFKQQTTSEPSPDRRENPFFLRLQVPFGDLGEAKKDWNESGTGFSKKRKT